MKLSFIALVACLAVAACAAASSKEKPALMRFAEKAGVKTGFDAKTLATAHKEAIKTAFQPGLLHPLSAAMAAPGIMSGMGMMGMGLGAGLMGAPGALGFGIGGFHPGFGLAGMPAFAGMAHPMAMGLHGLKGGLPMASMDPRSALHPLNPAASGLGLHPAAGVMGVHPGQMHPGLAHLGMAHPSQAPTKAPYTGSGLSFAHPTGGFYTPHGYSVYPIPGTVPISVHHPASPYSFGGYDPFGFPNPLPGVPSATPLPFSTRRKKVEETGGDEPEEEAPDASEGSEGAAEE